MAGCKLAGDSKAGGEQREGEIPLIVVESRLVKEMGGGNPFDPTVLRCISAPEFAEMGLGGQMRCTSAPDFGEMGPGGRMRGISAPDFSEMGLGGRMRGISALDFS